MQRSAVINRNLEREHDFAKLLCQETNDPVYLASSLLKSAVCLVIIGQWIGERQSSKQTEIEKIVFFKLIELMHCSNIRKKVIISGSKEKKEAVGVAKLGKNIIAVGGWKPEHDTLLALILLYRRLYDPNIRLHHFGIRHPMREKATDSARSKGVKILEFPARNHQCWYTKIQDKNNPKNMFYREDQWFPNGPHDIAIHWDFVTKDPHCFLQFIARVYGIKPEFWNDREMNYPEDVVKVKASDGKMMLVMARSTWLKIK